MSVINQKAVKKSDNLTASTATSRTPFILADSSVLSKESGQGVETSSYPISGTEVLEFIVSEMVKNEESSDVKEIKEKIRLSLQFAKEKDAGKALLRMYEALKIFKEKMDYGKEWDHKDQIRSRWGKFSLLFGLQIRFDIWSNIHYGFIGLRCGFSEEILKKAAGFMQWKSSKVPDDWLEKILGRDTEVFEALDDSVDQAAIDIGFRLAKIDGHPTNESLLHLMRVNIGRLN